MRKYQTNLHLPWIKAVPVSGSALRHFATIRQPFHGKRRRPPVWLPDSEIDRCPPPKTTFLDFDSPLPNWKARSKSCALSRMIRCWTSRKEISRLQKKSQEQPRRCTPKLTPWQISQVARHRSASIRWIVKSIFTDFPRAARRPRLCRRSGHWWAAWPLQWPVGDGDRPPKGRDAKKDPVTLAYRARKAIASIAADESHQKNSICPSCTYCAPRRLPWHRRRRTPVGPEAIGRNLYEMTRLRVPIICTVIGGAALATRWQLPWATS